MHAKPKNTSQFLALPQISLVSLWFHALRESSRVGRRVSPFWGDCRIVLLVEGVDDPPGISLKAMTAAMSITHLLAQPSLCTPLLPMTLTFPGMKSADLTLLDLVISLSSNFLRTAPPPDRPSREDSPSSLCFLTLRKKVC